MIGQQVLVSWPKGKEVTIEVGRRETLRATGGREFKAEWVMVDREHRRAIFRVLSEGVVVH